ncbi:MAG: hypothetical protein ACE5EL_00265 [Anaerolineae bacterium]
MTTLTVVGLFDESEAAARVLHQLAESPLDPQSVSVLHKDPVLQHSLSTAAGFQPNNSAITAAVAGAIVGGAIGAAATAVAPLLGYLLNFALGALVGSLAGAASVVLTRPLAIPAADAEALASAVEDGAVAVIVRADGMPTAHAIGDLFRAAGARGQESGASDDPYSKPARSSEPAAARSPSSLHDPFLPPGRRRSES